MYKRIRSTRMRNQCCEMCCIVSTVHFVASYFSAPMAGADHGHVHQITYVERSPHTKDFQMYNTDDNIPEYPGILQQQSTSSFSSRKFPCIRIFISENLKSNRIAVNGIGYIFSGSHDVMEVSGSQTSIQVFERGPEGYLIFSIRLHIFRSLESRETQSEPNTKPDFLHFP